MARNIILILIFYTHSTQRSLTLQEQVKKWERDKGGNVCQQCSAVSYAIFLAEFWDITFFNGNLEGIT